MIKQVKHIWNERIMFSAYFYEFNGKKIFHSKTGSKIFLCSLGLKALLSKISLLDDVLNMYEMLEVYCHRCQKYENKK